MRSVDNFDGEEKEDGEELFDEVVEDLKADIVEGQVDELGRVSDSVKQRDDPREKLKELKDEAGDDGPGDLVENFWDKGEIQYLLDKRKEMGNDELEEFFQKKSKLHEVDYNPFSRTEEKLLIQKHRSKTPKELANMLDRKERVVKIKLDLMGLKHGE